MAQVASNMLPLGTQAPEFTLLDTVSNKMLSLKQLKSTQATLIAFICNHCPFVKHIQQELVKLARDYQAKGVSIIAISSNDAVTYPQDGPSQMKINAEQQKYTFPYLYDETQQIAKAYDAACTPDFYVFDSDLKCVYRGQFDDSRPGNTIPVTGNDLRAALDNVLTGKAVNPKQKPSMGCSIKWKA